MTVHANGTHAKEIALYYLKLTQLRATPHIMGKTINQVKNLLQAGYTKEEIIDVMEYVILERKVEVYSFGYFSSCINDVLRDLKVMKERYEEEKKKKELDEQLASVQNTQRSEVSVDDQSAERNREKARRFNLQSRKRTQSYFDMFEGQ